MPELGSGFPCKNCGKIINIFALALPEMPDLISLTCPYCNHADSYEKESVRNVLTRDLPTR